MAPAVARMIREREILMANLLSIAAQRPEWRAAVCPSRKASAVPRVVPPSRVQDNRRAINGLASSTSAAGGSRAARCGRRSRRSRRKPTTILSDAEGTRGHTLEQKQVGAASGLRLGVRVGGHRRWPARRDGSWRAAAAHFQQNCRVGKAFGREWRPVSRESAPRPARTSAPCSAVRARWCRGGVPPSHCCHARS
jgi:hypothetical protein